MRRIESTDRLSPSGTMVVTAGLWVAGIMTCLGARKAIDKRQLTPILAHKSLFMADFDDRIARIWRNQHQNRKDYPL
jgi:hypothetical protein